LQDGLRTNLTSLMTCLCHPVKGGTPFNSTVSRQTMTQIELRGTTTKLSKIKFSPQ
jgi:hypothetical protein